MSGQQAQQFEIDGIHQISDLEELVGYNLKRAYVIVQNDFREAMGEEGLATRVFSALSLVIQNPNITQSKLARILGIERSGLVAIVDELEQRAFLTRTTVPGDRRVQALVPTSAGIAAYEKALAAVRMHESRLFADMSIEQKRTLIDLLMKIRSREEQE